MRTYSLTRMLPLVGVLVAGAWLVMPVAASQDEGSRGVNAPESASPTTDGATADGDDAADPLPVEYTALAVQRTEAPATTQPVTISIERWSTEQERQKLYTALAEEGPEALLDTLTALPSLGRFSTPDSVGYELHYATRTAAPDGGHRVSIATDRWVSYWEASAGGRSLEYPFTVIELRLGPDGEGEGRMSFATQISLNRELNILTLENYANQPVLLQGVRRVE